MPIQKKKIDAINKTFNDLVNYKVATAEALAELGDLTEAEKQDKKLTKKSEKLYQKNKEHFDKTKKQLLKELVDNLDPSLGVRLSKQDADEVIDFVVTTGYAEEEEQFGELIANVLRHFEVQSDLYGNKVFPADQYGSNTARESDMFATFVKNKFLTTAVAARNQISVLAEINPWLQNPENLSALKIFKTLNAEARWRDSTEDRVLEISTIGTLASQPAPDAASPDELRAFARQSVLVSAESAGINQDSAGKIADEVVTKLETIRESGGDISQASMPPTNLVDQLAKALADRAKGLPTNTAQLQQELTDKYGAEVAGPLEEELSDDDSEAWPDEEWDPVDEDVLK